MNYLSTNIKHLRNTKGLTQEDLARIVDKSRVLVSQWESDSREITTEDIIKLSNYFNVPMDLLVGSNLALNDKPYDEFEILFNKYKNILTESDKAVITTIINQRKKEIDEAIENGEVNAWESSL